MFVHNKNNNDVTIAYYNISLKKYALSDEGYQDSDIQQGEVN